jgi:hypothetical protein
MAQPEESDTDVQKRLGITYERLAAASADAVPSPVFDTAHIRTNVRETIRVLTEENTRLLRANAELARQVEALQARVGLPQDEKQHVPGSPGQSNAPTEPASATQKGKFVEKCWNCRRDIMFTLNRGGGWTCAFCGKHTFYEDLP